MQQSNRPEPHHRTRSATGAIKKAINQQSEEFESDCNNVTMKEKVTNKLTGATAKKRKTKVSKQRAPHQIALKKRAPGQSEELELECNEVTTKKRVKNKLIGAAVKKSKLKSSNKYAPQPSASKKSAPQQSGESESESECNDVTMKKK